MILIEARWVTSILKEALEDDTCAGQGQVEMQVLSIRHLRDLSYESTGPSRLAASSRLTTIPMRPRTVNLTSAH